MCFFPRPGINYNGRTIPFKCGGCPECLSERSRLWALRCGAEAKKTPGIMVTLTYDTYKYDDKGNIIGENISDKRVNKRDCQLFIKRLRKYADEPLLRAARSKVSHYINRSYKRSKTRISKREYKKFIYQRYADEIKKYINDYVRQHRVHIKYLLTAEYGKRTHRPHYHAILFNAPIGDCLAYKKSKRGNMIYTSPTLTKIWNNGICTVDSVSLNGKIARYCTKYCAKDSGSDDTFMLVSRGIGDEWLQENFNGKSYWMDGREYTIPKLIWQKWLERYWKQHKNPYTFKYVSKYRKVKGFDENGEYVDFIEPQFDEHWKAAKNRRKLQVLRDYFTIEYKRYIEYWSNKAEVIEKTKLSSFDRIRALPNKKYFFYKQAALRCLNENASKKGGINWHIPPRCNCIQYENRLYAANYRPLPLWKPIEMNKNMSSFVLPPSRHNKTNDTKVYFKEINVPGNPFKIYYEPVQLSFFE